MRNYVLAVLVGLAGLTVGAAIVVVDRHITGDLPPPAPRTLPGAAAVALPPPLSPPSDAAALPPPLATAPTPAPDSAAAGSATPGPGPAAANDGSGAGAPSDATSNAPSDATVASGSDLPNVDIDKLPVHPVPNDEPTVPTITLEDRNGKTLEEIKPSPPQPPEVAAAPTGPQSFVAPKSANGRNAFVPPVTLPPGSSASPARPASTTTAGAFEGVGQAMGGAVLSVGGHNVRLFGVRSAEPRDQCGLGAGDNRPCAAVARDALAQRLQHYPNVSCHVPPGQGSDAAAVCMDSSGTDLGGFLVAEGYALADTAQSFDYSGAEGAAHTFHRGLWKNR
jgi:endonuclease YncB( thermonuclease family)